MNEKEKNEIIETHDLYFAAFLAAKDCHLVDTRTDNKKVIFIFESPYSQQLLTGYYNNDENEFGMVSAMKYADRIRALKSRCFIIRR